MVAAALAGATLVGGVYSANKMSSATKSAANTQADTAQRGMELQAQQLEAVQKLLQPYVQAGTGALSQQQTLIGLNGAGPQQAAIDQLQDSPAFTSLLKRGETSILSNASATGNLRGGNVQAALAQFSPALLSQMIDQQYQRLGGIATMGQNSAAGVGSAGMSTTDQITRLLQQQGSAIAGGVLGQGQAQAGISNAITGSLGLYAGLGGFGPGRNPYTTPNLFGNYSNPTGETGDYRGAVLPDSMRGGF